MKDRFFAPQTMPPETLGWQPITADLERTALLLGDLNALILKLKTPDIVLFPLANKSSLLPESLIRRLYKPTSGEETREKDQNSFERHTFTEAINYRLGLDLGLKTLHQGHIHDRQTMLDFHQCLMAGNLRGKDVPVGVFREKEVHVGFIDEEGGQDFRMTHRHTDKIESSIDNLMRFMQSDFGSALIRAGIFQAQLLAIHPFLDGNGRVTRMYLPFHLMASGMLPAPVLNFEAAISSPQAYEEGIKEAYYVGIREFIIKKDATRWLQFFLNVVGNQALIEAKKLGDIHQLYTQKTKDLVTLINYTQGLAALDAFFSQTIMTFEEFSEISGLKHAKKVLRKLEKAELIAKFRDKSDALDLYALPELVNICEGKPVFVQV